MSQYIENCHELTEMSNGQIDEGAALAIGSFLAEAESLYKRILQSQVLTPAQRVSVLASIPPMFVERMVKIPPLRHLAKLATAKCCEYALGDK
ncbi:MAG TPA: hypothetical protein VFW62_05055 [bacterium]|nr:hypothetical protein [bacterium]